METSSNTEHRETDALAGALAKADLSQPSDTLGAHPANDGAGMGAKEKQDAPSGGARDEGDAGANKDSAQSDATPSSDAPDEQSSKDSAETNGQADAAGAGNSTSPPSATTGADGAVRIFVGDISRRTTEETLRVHFEKWGAVEDIVLKHPRGQSATPPRSFGFFSTRKECVEAIIGAVHVLDGYTIMPEVAKKRPRSHNANRAAAREQSPVAASAYHPDMVHKGLRKIFVGGLSHQTTEATLRAYFSRYGPCTDVVVMTEGGSGTSRKPRGFGFVTFESPAAVAAAIENRYQLLEGRMTEVKLAIPREAMLRGMHNEEPGGDMATGGVDGVGGGGMGGMASFGGGFNYHGTGGRNGRGMNGGGSGGYTPGMVPGMGGGHVYPGYGSGRSAPGGSYPGGPMPNGGGVPQMPMMGAPNGPPYSQMAHMMPMATATHWAPTVLAAPYAVPGVMAVTPTQVLVPNSVPGSVPNGGGNSAQPMSNNSAGSNTAGRMPAGWADPSSAPYGMAGAAVAAGGRENGVTANSSS